MTMTSTQTIQTTDAGISAERRSATTAAGEPPTMTTVTERDTATDAGSQLIDGYHILFSVAAAALPLRPATITRRLIDAIRVVGATLHLPPARRHYSGRQNYIERARMAREMSRL
jgi:hypothetical protein